MTLLSTCRKERNSCCKPNPLSLIFHHLGTSSAVFSITASAFYSAVVSESKFPTKLPFRLARPTCTEPGHWGSTHIITQQRWGHEVGSISTLLRLAESVSWWLLVSRGTGGITGAVFPPGSTRSDFGSLAPNWCSEACSYSNPWQISWTLECPSYTQKLTDSAAEDYLLLLLQWSHHCLIFFSAFFWMSAQIHRCAQEVDGTRGALKHLSCYFALPPRCY